MSKLTIVAKIVAKPEYTEKVKAALITLIEPTLAEEGCINYDLHQDNKNANIFLFYENWTSYDLWQKHMKSQHLADHQVATEGCVDEVEIFEMTQYATS